MRTLRVWFLMAVPAMVVCAADVSGKWSVQTSAAGRENTVECSLAEKEGTLSGKCVTPRGEVNLTGKVDGKKITWSYKTDSEGGMVTVVFNGTVESASKMSGTILAVEYSVEGEFSATRAN